MNKKWILGVGLVLALGFFLGNCSNKERMLLRKVFGRTTVGGIPTITVSTVGELEAALSNAISNIGNPASGTDTNIVSIPEAIGTIVAHPELVSQLPSSVDLGPLFNEGGGLSQFDKLTQGKTPEQIRDTWGNSVQVAFSSNIFKGMGLAGKRVTWDLIGNLPFINTRETSRGCGVDTNWFTMNFSADGQVLPGLFICAYEHNTTNYTPIMRIRYMMISIFNQFGSDGNNFLNFISTEKELHSISSGSSFFDEVTTFVVHNGDTKTSENYTYSYDVNGTQKRRIFADRTKNTVIFLYQLGKKDGYAISGVVGTGLTYIGVLIEGQNGEKLYMSGDHSALPEKNQGEVGYYTVLDEYRLKAKQSPHMGFETNATFKSSPVIFTAHFQKR